MTEKRVHLLGIAVATFGFMLIYALLLLWSGISTLGWTDCLLVGGIVFVLSLVFLILTLKNWRYSKNIERVLIWSSALVLSIMLMGTSIVIHYIVFVLL